MPFGPALQTILEAQCGGLKGHRNIYTHTQAPSLSSSLPPSLPPSLPCNAVGSRATDALSLGARCLPLPRESALSSLSAVLQKRDVGAKSKASMLPNGWLITSPSFSASPPSPSSHCLSVSVSVSVSGRMALIERPCTLSHGRCRGLWTHLRNTGSMYG